jgi:superfamily I DNA/RNA helicase
MTTVTPSAWRPHGIEDLEPAAWEALRYSGTACLTAGPGAGKTEFLAQRASYLLETGICPPPRRILAISFKRDSAANLDRRVSSRTPAFADRFVSMTFDAFTKSIVDRFRDLLPAFWRIDGTYSIRFVKDRDVRNFLDSLSESADEPLRSELFKINRKTFLPALVGAWALPSEMGEPAPARQYAIQQWWKQTYLNRTDPPVDFIALNRLAELVIRSSSELRTALRATYPFVFIDEFQDTTYAQYSFLHTIFGQGAMTPQITVVGDGKQRIMSWAGALSDAFAEFTDEFDAEQFKMMWNFRSSDALVLLQHRVAKMLDPEAQAAVSKAISNIDDDPAQLWSFDTEFREATTVAALIATDIEISGRTPAEYAIVARQTVAAFEQNLRAALAVHGLSLRNDDAQVGELKLQVLLKDRLARLLINILKLAAPLPGRSNRPEVWHEVSTTIARLRHGDMYDALATETDDELSETLGSLRSWLRIADCKPELAEPLLELLTDAVEAIADNYRTLCDRPEEATMTREAMTQRLKDVAGGSNSWQEAFDAYDAPNAVPLLTIHRSKGLEYHTVFFVGLENRQWWSHSNDVTASISAFFVGLSRAAQRVIFTRCDERGVSDGIAEFYGLLRESGIETRHFP